MWKSSDFFSWVSPYFPLIQQLVGLGLLYDLLDLQKRHLVVLLQGFSFAIYQAGTKSCHSSNPLLVQALINFTVGSVLWYFVGYSLSFGPSQEVSPKLPSFYFLLYLSCVPSIGYTKRNASFFYYCFVGLNRQS